MIITELPEQWMTGRTIFDPFLCSFQFASFIRFAIRWNDSLVQAEGKDPLFCCYPQLIMKKITIHAGFVVASNCE